MRRASAILGLLTLCAQAGAQSALPESGLDPSLRAFAQIRYRMAQSLETVRNYTCAETVRRIEIREKTRQRMEKRGAAHVEPDFADTVRLEVAVVDGREIYSWPGDEFRPVPLAEIVGFGMSASGAFSSFAKSLFVNSQGRIQYRGTELLDGRPTLRYDYEISLFRSGYTVTTQHGSAKVPHRGSFWADAETFELLRLTASVPDPPPELRLRSVDADIRYRAVPIGDTMLILAASSVFEMRHPDGTYQRNVTAFDDCREFGATAEVSFGPAPEDPGEPLNAAPPPAAVPLELPAGVELHVELVTPIGSAESRVGDRIEARLVRDVRRGGRTLVAREARVLGRLRRLQRVGLGEGLSYAVSLELTVIETEQGRRTVDLELARTERGANVSRTFLPEPDVRIGRRPWANGTRESVVIEQDADRGLADAETFYVRGSSFRLREGFQMTWRAAAPR